MPDDLDNLIGGLNDSTSAASEPGLSHDAAPPGQIGDFLIVREIARGGMGVVYEARHVRTGAAAAVKVVLPRRALTVRALEQFEREWRSLREIKHPNIGKLLDAGRYAGPFGDAPYYAIELVERPGGATARNVVEFARQTRLTLEQRVAMMIAVCGAVERANQSGIIHRDLKPSNILVDETEGALEVAMVEVPGRPKVLDFGLALVLGAAVVSPGGGAPAYDPSGTWKYMAPEQLRGETASIGAWTDTYALGLIAWELFTGVLPYDLNGLPPDDALRRMERGVRMDSRAINPKIDAELAGILDRAVAGLVAERTASAGRLQDQLESWLRSRTLRGGVIDAVRERISTYRWITLVGVSIVATLLAETLGVRVVFSETLNLGAPFEAALCRVGSPVADEPFEHVRVVALDDSIHEPGALDRACASLGLPPVDPLDQHALRALHARLAARIAAAARPRAIALDLWFEGSSPHDERVATELAAIDRSVPVILAMTRAEFDPRTGLPAAVSPALAEACPSRGAITGQFDPKTFWSVDLFVQRGTGAPIPSLSVMTFARAKQPDGLPTFTFNPADGSSRITLASTPENPGGDVIDLPEPYAVETIAENDDKLGLRTGDQVAKFVVLLPDAEDLRRETLSFAEVAAAADDSPGGRSKLSAWFRERIVIIGDARKNRPDHQQPDFWDYADGRSVSGVYAHAAAVEWLMDNRSVRQLSSGWTRFSTFAASLAGAAIVWWAVCRGTRRLASRRARLWRNIRLSLVGLAVVTVLLGGVSLILFRGGLVTHSPWISLIGLVVSAGLAALVVWVGKPPAKQGVKA